MGDDDLTRIDETKPTPGKAPARGGGDRPTPTPSSTGWLSSSGAIDHGRFEPGTLLGGRYRIVGRIGRGGMGEVFRADDLKLGQPVALKFLPADVDRDPARLTQLHSEVRMARQVSHPNVCRVYDIDEIDGHTFLSMEYVDGQDLASLLRRIGRFSTERAVALARQLCAGLAAAHERGVVHRDLKPANVMVDGGGKVRITDFGLAGAAGESAKAGTPAYMAPEQLAGGEVTPQSDIYALGLVLYELFTGQRAIDAPNLAELIRKREQSGILPPSRVVRDLDPAIDRAILRCLARDPQARPHSALLVAASLPGGDPLAAALAAGETPSPEMVAAAGQTSALRALPALASFLAVVASLVGIAALGDRVTITGVTPAVKPPAVLVDRATAIARALGYDDHPVDAAHGFSSAGDYLRYVSAHRSAVSWERLASGHPPLLHFWYRTSPRQLVPTGGNPDVTYGDPPIVISGMLNVVLDPDGRLTEFTAVPPQLEPPPAPARPTPWSQLFAAAELDLAAFRPVEPQWTPRTHSDERAAWEGPMPGWPEQVLRVEAAAYRGRPVFFQAVGPWTRPSRMQEVVSPRGRRILQAGATVFVILILVAAVLVARHNLRLGRGDRNGARRLAIAVFGAAMLAWIVGATHVPDATIELSRLFDGLGQALWLAGMIWLLYMALEPYVRRFWPETLISWTRLLGGAWRDSQVGRDVLVGCAFGALITIVLWGHVLALPALGLGHPPLRVPRLTDLEGLSAIASAFSSAFFNAVFNALWAIFGLVAVKLVVRRVWATAIVVTLVFTLSAGANMFDAGPLWLSMAAALLVIGGIVFLMLRFGLLATLTFFVFMFTLGQAVLTLNPDKWFFAMSCWMLAFGLALAGYGLYASRRGEPLLGRQILD